MGEIVDLVAAVMALSIPLSVVIGVFHLKSKKLSLKKFTDEERQVLLELKTENAELRRRLNYIEHSIGASSEDTLSSEREVEKLTNAQRLELIAKKKQ